jgi:hypothetical protein
MNTVLKRSLMPVAGLVLVATLAAGPGQEAPTPPQGFQLLDRLVTLMVKAVAPPGGGDIGPDVIALAKDLKAARQAKQVDDLFAVRYLRLLSGVRQALLMDPEVLYWPMYRSAMFDFVEERTGRAPDWKELEFMVNDHGGAGVGLGAIADAVMSEVVSLHIHLENLSRREQISKDYADKSLKAAGVLK